jgi:hypothetical protein
VAKRGHGGKGKRRKKKGGDVAPDRRVPRVSDTHVRPSWWWIGGGLAGLRLGRKDMVGWLVGCGPLKEVKVSYLIYSYFLFNSNLNPHK